jgi:hypothetical protein
VLVIWNEFEGLRSEERDQVILEAYSKRCERISMVMGATEREAEDQNLLPYMVDSGAAILAELTEKTMAEQINLPELRDAMVEEGGITLDSGKISLRFPTRAMAEDARERLAERLPRGKWTVSRRLDSIP